jgi:hypothetical protein
LENILGDFDLNGNLNVADIDLLTAEALAGTNGATFDLNNDGFVDGSDRDVWVNDLRNTYLGDSNLDGEFNSSNFVAVFKAGQYEDAIANNSTWATGDWNGDGEFDTSDFVDAFTGGGYEAGPRTAVAAVPKPSGLAAAILGLMSLSLMTRRRSR